MNLFYSFVFGCISYFILFSIYLELDISGLTNIWYRISSDGTKRLNCSSYFHFLFRPFYDIHFWYPSYWDMNYFIGSIVTSLLFYIFTN
jgi:hypothetical protein